MRPCRYPTGIGCLRHPGVSCTPEARSPEMATCRLRHLPKRERGQTRMPSAQSNMLDRSDPMPGYYNIQSRNNRMLCLLAAFGRVVDRLNPHESTAA